MAAAGLRQLSRAAALACSRAPLLAPPVHALRAVPVASLLSFSLAGASGCGAAACGGLRASQAAAVAGAALVPGRPRSFASSTLPVQRPDGHGSISSGVTSGGMSGGGGLPPGSGSAGAGGSPLQHQQQARAAHVVGPLPATQVRAARSACRGERAGWTTALLLAS